MHARDGQDDTGGGQRQLRHSNLGVTSIYLQGIDSAEIIDTVHARHPPMIPVNTTWQR